MEPDANDPTEAFSPTLTELIKRGFPLSLVVAWVLAAVGYFVSAGLPPVYQASATVLASQPSSSLGRFDLALAAAPPIDYLAYRTIALSDPVLAGAAVMLGDPDALEEIDLSVSVQDMRVSSLIRLDAKAATPTEASAAANAVALALIDWDKRRASDNLSTIVSTLEAQLTLLDRQLAARSGGDDDPQAAALRALRAEKLTALDAARALTASAIGLLELIEPAAIPLEPVAPRPLLTALLAFGLGAFLSYGAMLTWSAFDTRLKSADEIVRASRLPITAEFPRSARTHPAFRSATERLHQTLESMTARGGPKIVLVTGVLADKEKSKVALGLAARYAESGRRTLLLDADLRQPGVAGSVRIDPRGEAPRSLTTYLENPFDAPQLRHLQFDAISGLHIIPGFEPGPRARGLLRRGFGPALQRWTKTYEVIVVNATALALTGEALDVTPFSDAVVLTVDPARAERRRLQAAIAMLGRSGCRVMALVTVGADPEGDGEAAEAEVLEVSPEPGDAWRLTRTSV